MKDFMVSVTVGLYNGECLTGKFIINIKYNFTNIFKKI
jgi:hypothetical protein